MYAMNNKDREEKIGTQTNENILYNLITQINKPYTGGQETWLGEKMAKDHERV